MTGRHLPGSPASQQVRWVSVAVAQPRATSPASMAPCTAAWNTHVVLADLRNVDTPILTVWTILCSGGESVKSPGNTVSVFILKIQVLNYFSHWLNLKMFESPQSVCGACSQRCWACVHTVTRQEQSGDAHTGSTTPEHACPLTWTQLSVPSCKHRLIVISGSWAHTEMLGCVLGSRGVQGGL